MPTPPPQRTRSDHPKRPAFNRRIRRGFELVARANAVLAIECDAGTLTPKERRDIAGLSEWFERWRRYCTGDTTPPAPITPPTPTLFEDSTNGESKTN